MRYDKRTHHMVMWCAFLSTTCAILLYCYSILLSHPNLLFHLKPSLVPHLVCPFPLSLRSIHTSYSHFPFRQTEGMYVVKERPEERYKAAAEILKRCENNDVWSSTPTAA